MERDGRSFSIDVALPPPPFCFSMPTENVLKSVVLLMEFTWLPCECRRRERPLDGATGERSVSFPRRRVILCDRRGCRRMYECARDVCVWVSVRPKCTGVHMCTGRRQASDE